MNKKTEIFLDLLVPDDKKLNINGIIKSELSNNIINMKSYNSINKVLDECGFEITKENIGNILKYFKTKNINSYRVFVDDILRLVFFSKDIILKIDGDDGLLIKKTLLNNLKENNE